MTEKFLSRDSLMRDFEISKKLDEIMTDGPNNQHLKDVSPSDKHEVRRQVGLLLDRAFDAGIVYGVSMLTSKLVEKSRIGEV